MRPTIGVGVSLSIVALAFLGPATASGALLDLNRLHYPLVYAGAIQVDYYPNAGSTGEGLLTGVKSVTNPLVTVQLTDSDPGTTYMGSFSLQLEVVSGGADDGMIVAGGSHQLRVAYKPTPMSPEQVAFYSTTPLAFGYGPEDKFEFKFLQQGTTPLADDGETVAVILPANSIPNFSYPSFGSEFHNNANGESNTFLLPEPGTCALMALGVMAALRRRRSRR